MAECRSVVETFLERIDLREKYYTRLESQGYKTAFDLCLLQDKDLDLISITDPEDRAKILQEASELDIQLWLEHLGLEDYLSEFKREGILTVQDLKLREITDDLLDTLEIMIPGHRKRLKWAVSFLKWYSEPDNRTVVIGYWGQPPEMEGSNRTFLCVPGYLKSDTGEDALSSDLIRFTVDSASEIGVTVTERLIAKLCLKYLHNIESRGVHAAADKPVYRGILRLGKEEMEVEVMPDRFNTVGNTVMKKFKHYINGTLHRWLKNDPPSQDD